MHCATQVQAKNTIGVQLVPPTTRKPSCSNLIQKTVSSFGTLSKESIFPVTKTDFRPPLKSPVVNKVLNKTIYPNNGLRRINTGKMETVGTSGFLAENKCPIKQKIKPVPVLDKCKKSTIKSSRIDLTISGNDKQSVELKTLKMLEMQNVVNNVEPFDCSICLDLIPAGQGVKLKSCFHTFCRNCLTQTINTTDDVKVKCPFLVQNLDRCNMSIRECEIKDILPSEDHSVLLRKRARLNEQLLGNTLHCQQKDCLGFFILEPNDNKLKCEVCLSINCVKCKAIHTSLTCKEYKEYQAKKHPNFVKNEEQISNLIRNKFAMKCPKCKAVIEKVGGCALIQCVYCKTYICWVTRGPRWGPKGVGDISGGCRCMVNGKKCHPDCTTCH